MNVATLYADSDASVILDLLDRHTERFLKYHPIVIKPLKRKISIPKPPKAKRGIQVRVTAAEKLEFRRLYNKGMTQTQIGKKLGRTQPCVGRNLRKILPSAASKLPLHLG